VINPSAMMIGVLSDRPRNLANLDINQENDTMYRYEYWQTVPLTPETLPDDPELLNSFGMIVLDDLDPALLTEKQRQALLDWVAQGRVLLCGGGTAAPRNLAFLGERIGLYVTEFTVSDSVYGALENLIGQSASGKQPEVALARIQGGTPVVSDDAGNGLIWQEKTGAGRIYVMAWEAGDAALNTQSLMHVFWQQLLIQDDASLYSKILYLSDSTGAMYPAGDETPVTVRNTLPAAVAVIGGAALIGLALWFVLKKADATKWMWAAIPVLALAAGTAVTLMAGSSMLNRPVASITVNLTEDEDGNRTRFLAVSAAAPGIGLHRYSMEGEDLKIRLYTENYWMYEEEEDEPKEPVTLRSVRTSGAGGGIALNGDTPWKSVEMYSIRNEEGGGRVDAEIWMEEDGLHGTVTNGTEFRLREGAVICAYGYVRIPALAPGESTEFALIEEASNNSGSPVFTDGRMLRNVSASFYTVANALWLGTDPEKYDYSSLESILSGMASSAADYLSGDGQNGSGQESMTFVYCAQPEETLNAEVYADGEKIESVAVLPMLTAKIRYAKIGRTGVVFHAPGMDKPVRCELDANGMPDGDMKEDGNTGKYYKYYELSELPTFRFSPEDVGDTEIDRLEIGVEQWYVNDLRCYVLNAKLQVWVEVQPNTALNQPEQYLDREGNLYCQFRPKSGDMYSSMPAPTLTLEGRVKDAET